jgi:hypothetical protein
MDGSGIGKVGFGSTGVAIVFAGTERLGTTDFVSGRGTFGMLGFG